MLYLVTSHDGDDFVFSVIINDMLSNHATVDIELAITKPWLPKIKVTYQKYHAADITQLYTDILESDLSMSAHSTKDNLEE